MFRRQFLRHAGATGLTLAAARSLTGCAGGLPKYEYDGPLGPETTFENGIASGDPLSDAVILWTRAKGAGDDDVEVFFELARDEAFENRLAADWTTATAARDHTVKIDVRDLPAGTTLYYRFFALGRESAIGRTRTAPDGDVSRLRFAVVSCSSYAHGYFHVYRHLAGYDDLDAVLHLGDYIYEYASGDYGSERPLEPVHEILTLDDYRTRYAQYRRDPDLQELHRAHPVIAVWDDHESANNAWRDGAENHDPATEGEWSVRIAAAHRAYAEWMPIREQASDDLIYRTLPYGSLVDVIMLDTRNIGRDEQVGTSEESADESRSLLGLEQEAWLHARLDESRARWKLLGQQVMMAQFGLGANARFNFDQWDGYDAARQRLLGHIRTNGIENVVFLTGDIHMSWGNDVAENPYDDTLYDPATGTGAIAVEIVTPSVTSPNAVGFGTLVDGTIRFLNPHVRFLDMDHRGYVILDIDESRIRSEWSLIDGVGAGEGALVRRAFFEVRSGVPHLVEVS